MENEKILTEAIQADIQEACGGASYDTEDIVNKIVVYLHDNGPSSEFSSLLEKYREELFANVEDNGSQELAQRILAAEKRREEIYFLEDSWGKLIKSWLDENADEKLVCKSLDDIYNIAPKGKPTKKWTSRIENVFSEYSKSRVLSVIRTQLNILVESKDVLEKGLCMDNERKLKPMILILTINKCEEDAELLKKLALVCYTKVPCVGPISTGVGNLCLKGLSELDGKQGLIFLSELSRKLKYPTNAADFAKKRLAESAKEKGFSVQDLESMIVPDYGLKA